MANTFESSFRKSSIPLCLLFVVQLVLLTTSTAHRILLLPILAKSHVFSITAIGRELVGRGHEVHLLVAQDFPLLAELTPNQSGITVLRYRSLEQGGIRDWDGLFEKIAMKSMETKGAEMGFLPMITEDIHEECRCLFLKNEELFQDLLRNRYDLALVDSLFFARLLYLVPVRLGIPWITHTDLALNPWLVRVPWLPSFHHLQATNFMGKMTFAERVQNTLITLVFHLYPIFPDPPEDILSVYRKYGDFSSMDDLISRSLLFVISSDVVLDEPLPFMPNMINAGGLTVKPSKSKSLPTEFEAFIGTAKSGVIVISFGTMASKLPMSITQKFIDAFSRLPDLHFIWRFKNTDKLTLPKNVMVADWLPQNDLLADTRVKLFITHSGNNGQFEAVYHGVPMIGFPLFGDQVHNAKRLELRGYGLSMSIHDFTSDQLLENIRKILSDPSYKKRVSLASEIFRSAPRSPAERVADGVEHVLRFGADHLRSAGNDLPLYQYLMLDIIAFTLVVIAAVFLLVWKTIRFFIRRIFSGSGHRHKMKSQ